MTEETPTGLAVGPGEGERVRSPLGGDITFIVRGGESNGALAALEAVAPPGEGPPLHIHSREDETIYVLEGEFRWRLGEERSVTGPGSFVFVPRGLPHAWQCLGERPGKMLITFAPAGMEGFFESLSSMREFDPEEFRRAGAEHGMDVVGPPLAVSDPL
jgi:quercetin dioxygenase-like cupin family protein